MLLRAWHTSLKPAPSCTGGDGRARHNVTPVPSASVCPRVDTAPLHLGLPLGTSKRFRSLSASCDHLSSEWLRLKQEREGALPAPAHEEGPGVGVSPGLCHRLPGGP